MSESKICRRARPDDYKAVLAIDESLYGGRDKLPYMYSKYLADPNRICHVVEQNGEIIAFLGSRRFDDGFSLEGFAARTKVSARGHFVMRLIVYQLLQENARTRFLKEGFTHHFVTMNTDVVQRKNEMLIHGYRRIIYLCWDMPVNNLSGTVNGMQQIYLGEPGYPTVELDLHQLREVLSSDDLYAWLPLARGKILVDHQSYTLGFANNANIILNFGTTVVRATESLDGGYCSLSFCTVVPCGNALDNLSVNMEYYGPEDKYMMRSHLQGHLGSLVGRLHQYPKVNRINSHIIVPKAVCSEEIELYLSKMKERLNFRTEEPEDQAFGVISYEVYQAAMLKGNL